MLELIAVSGSLAVKWVSAKGGVSFGGGGVWGGVGGEIAGAGRVVDWWARIKRSLARNGFADELV